MYTKRPNKSKLCTLENLPLDAINVKYSQLMQASLDDWAQRLEDDPSNAGSKPTSLLANQQAQLDAYLSNFTLEHRIPANADWFFEQMLSKFAELPLVRGADGLLDPIALFKEIRKSPFKSGLLVIALQDSRSSYIKGQTDVRYRNYGALVPLVLSAFKKYKNIPYSNWSRNGLNKLVAPNLLSCMLLSELPDITKEEVLELRKYALTPQSGVNKGKMSSPMSTYRLYMPVGSPLGRLPKLAQIMLCQTWAAHPVNRTDMMILNPLAWDDMPEQLVETAVLAERKVATVNPRILDGDAW